MKTPVTIFALLLVLFTTYSQDPAIMWQNTIGGSKGDSFKAFEATADGGTILAGLSFSNISGDKTENSNGRADLWIVKTDNTGNIEWQNTIGGSESDYAHSIKQTSDGGYIVGGTSDSNISGDKTENSKGLMDYWILKLNSLGDILWQKTYGGAQNDIYPKIVETTEGGYFVGGYSRSGVGGDKTEPSNGSSDFWVLKLDNSGTIVWQKTIGGSRSDDLNAVLQTPDGGYMLGGTSNSNASGDKSENSKGEEDYWIVKLDSSGNVEWDKTIGGDDWDNLWSIITTSDGNYLLTGWSSSHSGDITQPVYGIISYWILKIDANGNILWDQTIGGSHLDRANSAVELGDGSYLISGTSDSNISGNKTDNSHGEGDYWLVRLGASGNIISQKSIGGSLHESDSALILVGTDGNYLMACSSNSNISGDKSENSEGEEDYWVFKTTPGILGVEQNDMEPTFNVYPNPNSGLFTINLGKEYTDVTVQTSNTLGQIISSEKYALAKTIEQEINASAGIYFVKVSTPKEGSSTLQIIKQ